MTNHLQAALFGAVGYGVGFAANVLILLLLLVVEIASVIELIDSTQFLTQTIVGLIFGMIAFGLTGALGGAIGGYVLACGNASLPRRGFVWRSALAFGLAEGILLLPFLIFIFATLFYDQALLERLLDRLLLAVFLGGIFGALVSLFLSLLLRLHIRQWGRIALSCILGFAAGGALVALLSHYLPVIPNLILQSLFGAAGGAALGHVISRETPFDKEVAQPRVRHKWLRRFEIALGVVLGIVVIYLGYNIANLIRVNLIPLNPMVAQSSIGTHWQEQQPLQVSLPESMTPALFVDNNQRPYLTWIETEDGDPYVAFTTQSADDSWSVPVRVSPVADVETAVVHGTVDTDGTAHLVWSDSGIIQYTACVDGSCSQAVNLSTLAADSCPTADTNHQNPVIAVADDQTLTAVWQTDTGQLMYASWSAGDEVNTSGCVSTPDNARDPQLVALPNNQFALAFSAGDSQIWQTQFADGSWSTEAVQIGAGESPTLMADVQGNGHTAWCNAAGQVMVADAAGSQIVATDSGCHGRPALAQDGQGVLHLLWIGDQFSNVTGGQVTDNPYIFESVLLNDGWSDPALVSAASANAAPVVQVDADGNLHALWLKQDGTDNALAYSTQSPYTCDASPQTAAGQAMLTAVTDPLYLPDKLPPTYCGNRFEDILFVPDLDPVFAGGEPTETTAFHDLADLVETAQYEALIVNMKWEENEEGEGPGLTVSRAINNLYEKVKADPSQYPRGMRVRIVLGNLPAMQPFSLDRQVYHVLADLRDAGLPTMVDEEIGWQVEVADYRGSWPHSHVKMAIIDGKTVLGSGFNIAFEHFLPDHPSGLGLGLVDFGLVFTGPVAQSAMAAYDDIWQASEQIQCATLLPTADWLWPLACHWTDPVATHVPEVLKYEVPSDGEDVAFSLYRSRDFLGADAALLNAIGAAEERIDLFQVNFSLELACGAGVLIPGICNYENNAPNYIRSIVDVVEEKRIPVHILTDQFAAEGYENKVAIQALQDELEARGLSDLVEIHFYNGRMHSKVILIDDNFLVIGSQNFHYSAWGEFLALNEYNIATENQEAVDAYRQAFDYFWQNSVSAKTIMDAE